MTREKLKDYKKAMKKTLDGARYRHSVGVAETARCLAMRYKEDMDRAYTAGILHDCAKYIPDGERIVLCGKWGIPVNDVERHNPTLLHAKMGARLAEKKYGIEDPEILSAIRYHTTGHAGMTLLEKIVYVADYIEPLRDKAPNLTEIRSEAFRDIDRAIYLIARDTILYMNEQKQQDDIDPETVRVFDYYKALTEGNSQ